jgi:AcrR family transcriptional regulator
MRFSARGFEATTVRAVARDASVDPALILSCFASKARLFPAAMGDGQSTADTVRQAVGGTRPGAERRLVSPPLPRPPGSVVRFTAEMLGTDLMADYPWSREHGWTASN